MLANYNPLVALDGMQLTDNNKYDSDVSMPPSLIASKYRKYQQ